MKQISQGGFKDLNEKNIKAEIEYMASEEQHNLTSELRDEFISDVWEYANPDNEVISTWSELYSFMDGYLIRSKK